MEGTPQAQDTFRFYFDSNSDRQIRAASLMHAFDVWSQVELVDRRAPQGPVVPPPARLEVHTPDGKIFTGFSLFVCIVRSLWLLWPVAMLTWIPGIGRVGNAFYPSTEAK